MPIFHYRALNTAGQIIEGELEAREERQVVERLRQQALLPLRISTAPAWPRELSWRHWRSAWSLTDLVRFSHELAVLLRAGLPLDRALRVLRATSSKPAWTSLLEEVERELRGGKSLSEALEQTRKFSPLYLSLIRAGETGGFLEVALERLAAYLTGVQEFRTSILTALIYPTILLTVGGLAIIFMLLYVVPRFAVFFQEMGQSLMWSTQLLLAASRALRQYGWLLPPLLLLSGLLGWWLASKPRLRLLWHRYKLHLPILGDLNRKLGTVFFARTLGTLLQNGVSLLPALDLSGQAVANLYLRQALAPLVDQVQRGQSLGRLLARLQLLPEICVQLILVGEESGRLADMLLEAAAVLEGDIRTQIKKMLALLEPCLILVMGLLVAFIIVSLLLPILNLYEFSL